MAVIKLTGLVKSVSGVVGNLTFSQDGRDTIMKDRSTPANPRTISQSSNRTYFSLSSKGYPALSAANAALWKKYAQGLTFIGKKGKKPYTPNAFEAYKSLTQVWYAANGGVGTPPVAPPTTTYAEPAITVNAMAAGGYVKFHGSAPTPAGTVVEFLIQPLRNANRTPSEEGYRVAGFDTFTADNGNDVTFAVAPGVYAAAYRFVEKATGRRSARVEIKVSGVALALEDGGAIEASKAKRKAA